MKDIFLIEMDKEIESVNEKLNIFHNVLTDGRSYDYDKGTKMALEINKLCKQIDVINDFLDNRFKKRFRFLRVLGLGVITSFICLLFTGSMLVYFILIVLSLSAYKGYKYMENYRKETFYLENKTEITSKRIVNLTNLLVNKETKKKIVEVALIPKNNPDDILDEEIAMADYLLSLMLDSEVILEISIPDNIKEIMVVRLQDTLESTEEDLTKLLHLAKKGQKPLSRRRDKTPISPNRFFS